MSKKNQPNQVRYNEPKRQRRQMLKEDYQANLPLADQKPTESQGTNGVAKLNGGFSDCAFADNKQRPIHRWIPWIAGFSSEFVRDAFKRYLPNHTGKAAVVVDPFYGVGTTLIEALRCGHDATGFEINPYAALAARTKCEAVPITPARGVFCVEQCKRRT